MSLDSLPDGAGLERLLEGIEIAQYEDFFDTLPPDVREELGVGMDRDGGILRLTAAGFAETAAQSGVVRLRGWAKHLGPADPEIQPRSELRVVRLGSEASVTTPDEASLAEVWATIGVRIFGFPAPFVRWLRALHGRERWHLYLALDGGTRSPRSLPAG